MSGNYYNKDRDDDILEIKRRYSSQPEAVKAALNAGWPLADAVKSSDVVDGVGNIKASSPLLTQIGGNHYKDLAIQPAEYNHANNIPYMEGNVIKYVTRWRKKGGIKDLEKAKHYLELLIEMETKHASK